MSRISTRFPLLVGLIVFIVGVSAVAPALRAASGAAQITPPIPDRFSFSEDTFFDQTFSVNYSGSGVVLLAADSAGTAPFRVDDAVDVIVTPPGGGASTTTTFDFSQGACGLGLGPAHAPAAISGFAGSGLYSVRVVLRNICPFLEASSELWLVGVTPSQARVSFLNSGSIQFGAWNVGQCSGWNSINIRNEGPDPLTGVTATITDADAADFQFMNGTRTQAIPTLGVQQTYAILVKFCPTGTARMENATLTLSGGNLQGGTQSIGLTGSGKLK